MIHYREYELIGKCVYVQLRVGMFDGVSGTLAF